MQEIDWGLEPPQVGAALKRHLELDQPTGLAYERCLSYEKSSHSHPRLTIAHPRNRSRVVFSFSSEGWGDFEVCSDSLLIFPPKLTHRQHAVSRVWDVLALYPSADLLSESLRNLSKPVQVPASWRQRGLLDRIYHSVVVNGAQTQGHLQTYRSFLESVDLAERESKKASFVGTELPQMLCFLESNLFSNTTSEEMAEHFGRSVPSLFRDFEKEFGLTPRLYARKRRFEEAAYLLESGEKGVEEVCFLVGYSDVASFSRNFKKIYGTAPLHYKEKMKQKINKV